MKTMIRLGVLSALVVALYGQAKPKDVDGWDKVKWGMTLAEVRSAYSSRTTEEYPGAAAKCFDSPIHYCLSDRGPYVRLLDRIEIGPTTMEVTVQAGYGSAKVVSVELVDLAGGLVEGHGIRNFDTLRTLLIQKYGTPANQETKLDDIGAHVTTVLWTLPSTAIRLSLREEKGIFLEYKATDKKALDKL
jgi:hypothetical protein